jgi:hypothetical protein
MERQRSIFIFIRKVDLLGCNLRTILTKENHKKGTKICILGSFLAGLGLITDHIVPECFSLGWNTSLVDCLELIILVIPAGLDLIIGVIIDVQCCFVNAHALWLNATLLGCTFGERGPFVVE